MIRRFVIISVFLLSIFSIIRASDHLTVERISPNVYVVMPKTDSLSTSNSVFIILEKSVLVIDTQASKDLAEELLLEIKKVTPKPVRYLVNTHFHRDHTGGNLTLSPKTQMILHHETLERLKENSVVLDEPVISLRYECSLIDANNVIHINWLGEAHTKGDLFIHIPQEDILILGDLFFHEIIPYVKDGQIGQWIVVLDRIIKNTKISESKVVVPGHGPVSSFQALRQFRELLAWSRGVVNTEYEKGTERERIIEAAKETKLYKTRISKYGHQDRLADLLDKVYEEFTGVPAEPSAQQ